MIEGVECTGSVELGAREIWARQRASGAGHDAGVGTVVLCNGQRVVTIVPTEPSTRLVLNLVINWLSELEP